MRVKTFVIQVEDVSDEDFNITDTEADKMLSAAEDVLNKQNYSIYDSWWETEDM